MSQVENCCEIDIRVRYVEVDAFGYLHHSHYFVYFEMGRTELLARSGLRYKEMEERGIFYVVARLECRYRAPARYDEVLTLRTTLERLTPIRVEHAYRLMRGSRLLAEASSTLVSVGRDGRPLGLPDDLYALMSRGVPATISEL